MIRTVEWRAGAVVMIDQRRLPGREEYRTCRTAAAVAGAIHDMVVRGAPAIGVAAAMGVAVGTQRLAAREFDRRFHEICDLLRAARPTAVNLAWAVDRMQRVREENRDASLARLKKILVSEARAIHREDVEANRRLGRYGARLLPARGTVLTYCNAGALATAGYGTALGVIRAAREAGKKIDVVACETRPYLQGARLTAWELRRDRIPVTLITDGMVGRLMQLGKVQAVVVGTDRSARNGDVANKIGTYMVAALAARHQIPFLVAAPTSSIDLQCRTGEEIPIEERAASEVTEFGGRKTAPDGVGVWNPAFDVTPARLVTAIVTERGVARPPFRAALERLARGGGSRRRRSGSNRR